MPTEAWAAVTHNNTTDVIANLQLDVHSISFRAILSDFDRFLSQILFIRSAINVVLRWMNKVYAFALVHFCTDIFICLDINMVLHSAFCCLKIQFC